MTLTMFDYFDYVHCFDYINYVHSFALIEDQRYVIIIFIL
jgi:hypothetical protein